MLSDVKPRQLKFEIFIIYFAQEPLFLRTGLLSNFLEIDHIFENTAAFQNIT